MVALIGVFTAKITSGARKDAKTNADQASRSAAIAGDYAAALGAKDALLESVNARLKFVEEHDENCTSRVEELERRLSESDANRREISDVERRYYEEVSKLRAELRQVKLSQLKPRRG